MEDDLKASGELNRMIQREIETMLDRLEKLRQQSKFASFTKVHVPMVLVLGNHSSGKSTFINHMLGQEVQKTGRAPTDCMFTVLMGGKRAERLDGYALSRDNKFGFQDIKGLFGADFVSQVELKVLENCALLDTTGMMIIDSPGMIDPPGTTQTRDRTDMDRGYDFKKVVRWLAERADIILVMFDPDKPGTTFESLDVLTTSLNHVNSKVRLILNKVDDFKTVHDFARAYGALCWNLSKVIPRKDMPFIYTMYVPVNGAPDNQLKTEEAMLQTLLHTEFDGTRGEILREVQRAPDLATDNMLTAFKSLCAKLKMHVTLIEACQKEYKWIENLWHGITMGLVAAGVGVSVMYIVRTWGVTDGTPAIQSSEASSTQPMWKQEWAKQVAMSKRAFRWGEFLKLTGTSAAASLLSWKAGEKALAKMQADVLSWLPTVFASTYASRLIKSDRTHDETIATYNSILPGLEMALTQTRLDGFEPFSLPEKSYLDDVLATHVPRLDRCVRDRSGDDYAYLRFKHYEKPSLQ
ncbi:EH domain-containing protein 1 [Aphanomyces cochlioides]|nr:EH domain-containing protein 1 [Aphanomyces cochlioides]